MGYLWVPINAYNPQLTSLTHYPIVNRICHCSHVSHLIAYSCADANHKAGNIKSTVACTDAIVISQTHLRPNSPIPTHNMSPITIKEEVTLKVGDTVPEGTFKYVPYSPELADNVSIPSNFTPSSISTFYSPFMSLVCLRRSYVLILPIARRDQYE